MFTKLKTFNSLVKDLLLAFVWRITISGLY